jgi:circadian clock protein KaiB
MLAGEHLLLCRGHSQVTAVPVVHDLMNDPPRRVSPARGRGDQGGFLAIYVLRLYVTGKTSKAELAIANLKRICDQELRGEYELQVIDVLEQPQMAEDEKILATPTLIKQLPPPLRRVIGDLSDKEKVLLGLEVFPDLTSPTE